MWRVSVRVRSGSERVQRGSVRCGVGGSVRVRHGSVRVRHGSVGVRHDSVQGAVWLSSGCSVDSSGCGMAQYRVRHHSVEGCGVAVLIGENTSKKTGQMSSNFGEIIKKLISVFGRKPPRGLPKPSPSAPRLDSVTFIRGENAKLTHGVPNPPAGLRRGEKGRGGKYCVSLIT